MTREEVMAMIIEFAANAFKADINTITADTKIAEELGVASTQRVALSAAIDNEFEVMIPVARMGNFETIADLTNFVIDEM